MAGGAGGEMANLAAQGHCMARLAGQNQSWPFWQASTTIFITVACELYILAVAFVFGKI
jgi:hypothetical protein